VVGQTYFTQGAKSSSGCKGTCQLIPPGTKAYSLEKKVRIYGCNLYLLIITK
jgi:hypothetical protein